MIDITTLFREKLGNTMDEYLMPPPSFSIMQCEIILFDEKKKSIVVKIPILENWLNPYRTMQGGMIVAAIDNAIGPLSMLVAPKNMTRDIETKLLKTITMDLEFIYVYASLLEHKKRRLIFDVLIKDKDENIYAKSKITNWII